MNTGDHGAGQIPGSEFPLQRVPGSEYYLVFCSDAFMCWKHMVRDYRIRSKITKDQRARLKARTQASMFQSQILSKRHDSGFSSPVLVDFLYKT